MAQASLLGVYVLQQLATRYSQERAGREVLTLVERIPHPVWQLIPPMFAAPIIPSPPMRMLRIGLSRQTSLNRGHAVAGPHKLTMLCG